MENYRLNVVLNGYIQIPEALSVNLNLTNCVPQNLDLPIFCLQHNVAFSTKFNILCQK